MTHDHKLLHLVRACECGYTETPENIRKKPMTTLEQRFREKFEFTSLSGESAIVHKGTYADTISEDELLAFLTTEVEAAVFEATKFSNRSMFTPKQLNDAVEAARVEEKKMTALGYRAIMNEILLLGEKDGMKLAERLNNHTNSLLAPTTQTDQSREHEETLNRLKESAKDFVNQPSSVIECRPEDIREGKSDQSKLRMKIEEILVECNVYGDSNYVDRLLALHQQWVEEVVGKLEGLKRDKAVFKYTFDEGIAFYTAIDSAISAIKDTKPN